MAAEQSAQVVVSAERLDRLEQTARRAAELVTALGERPLGFRETTARAGLNAALYLLGRAR